MVLLSFEKERELRRISRFQRLLRACVQGSGLLRNQKQK
jgi:hypothetical protein